MSVGPIRPVAFITGASSGIGAQAVRLFALDGWNVAAGARRQDKLAAAIAAAQTAAPEAQFLPLACDVNSDESVTAAFQALKARFGRLDALVNNAGYGSYGTVAEAPLKQFRENMETNYFGVLRCTQAALPLLREAAQEPDRRFRPAIVMLSSFVGKRALPAMSSYCATKFAVEALSESLRVEVKDDGITVSVINPGVTQTEFFQRAEGDRPKGYIHPASGMTPEAVARYVLWAVRHPRRNVYLSFMGQLGIFTQWLCPSLLDFVASKTWKGRAE